MGPHALLRVLLGNTLILTHVTANHVLRNAISAQPQPLVNNVPQGITIIRALSPV